MARRIFKHVRRFSRLTGLSEVSMDAGDAVEVEKAEELKTV